MKEWIMTTIRIFIYIAIFFSAFFNGQEQPKYPFFPKDQHFYLGSFPEFYKDFHKILIEKNLKPCENKSEYFTAFVLIRTDNTVEILQNQTAEKIKCSYNLTKEVIKHMDKWLPARIDKEPRATIAQLPIYVDDLFDNYKEGYLLTDYLKYSDFNISTFREEVVKYIDYSDFVLKSGKEPLRLKLNFSINENGEMSDLKIINGSGLVEFDDMVLNAVKKVVKKRKWEPAKIHNIPINSVFNFPITFR
ncbi:MAG: energy transducer TonB [Soonwooa sp.]